MVRPLRGKLKPPKVESRLLYACDVIMLRKKTFQRCYYSSRVRLLLHRQGNKCVLQVRFGRQRQQQKIAFSPTVLSYRLDRYDNTIEASSLSSPCIVAMLVVVWLWLCLLGNLVNSYCITYFCRMESTSHLRWSRI